ncbi:hypothetical protein IR215_29570 [Simulacricoccus sp. 17bor-14]|nr:hypothetical protein [Simulacricoccus sp. 17bor-14]
MRGRVRSTLPLLLLLLLTGLALPVRAQAVREGSLRLSAGTLVDGNAPRDFTETDGSGASAQPDVGLHLLGSAAGRYTAERYQLVGRYDLGTRLYLRYRSQSLLVQAGTVEASHALGPTLGAGVEARAKDRRGGARAYSDLGASAFLEYVPDVRLDVRLRAGAHRFVYRPDERADFGGPELSLTGRYRIDRRHSLSASGEWGRRRYGVGAQSAPELVSPALGRREDQELSAGVGYAYRGPVALSFGYGFQELASNSYGETLLRHRLSASAGVHLPLQFTLLAQGALVLSHYPDGVFLSPDIILTEDEEAQNNLSLRLVRPLTRSLDLELSGGIYGTRLPRNGLSYTRSMAGVGVTWRL